MKTIPIGRQFSLSEDRKALELYYNEYKPLLEKLCDIDFKDFEKHNCSFDIYGLYKDNILCGCIYFEQIEQGFIFHIAVSKDTKWKWMRCWPELKNWMLENYFPLFGVTHREDAYTNRLIARSGFTYIEATENFYWWRLWAEQPD